MPRKLFLFGAFFFFLTLYLVFNSPYFRLENIEVTGNERVPADEIRVLSGLIKGTSLLSLRPQVVAGRIKANPWLEEVKIGFRWPATLRIEVREREPSAVVPLPQGQFLLIDSKGVALEVGKETGSLPVVTGGALRDFRLGEELTPVGYRWGAAVAEGLKTLRGDLSEVNVDSDQNITLYLRGGLPVFLGSADASLGDRLEVLLSILADTKSRRSRLQYIDLRFAGRPVVKER
ncbi:MAG: FtsQ-type POTRA domain-containing protein [Firmicutes bacterium]|nr:FtsQ-type POTRA domain-containing protein [Bacillota bacterium]